MLSVIFHEQVFRILESIFTRNRLLVFLSTELDTYFFSFFFLSRTKGQTFLTETNANYRRALRFPIEMSFDTVKAVAFRWCNLEARAPLNAKRLQFDTFVLGGMQIRISSIVPVLCPLDKSRRLFFSASPKWIFQGPPSFEPDTSRPHESHNLLA